MRLLYLNHNVAYTGTFFRAFHLGREMVRRGHSVTLVTTSARRRLGFEQRVEDGVLLVLAPDLLPGQARTGWDPSNVLRRMLHLRGQAYDLVHAFDSRPAVVLPALARPADCPLVMDWADWWGRGGTIRERSGLLVRALMGPVETWFEESFRTRAHGTTVISSALAQRAIALGVKPDRVLQFPHGCTPVPPLATPRADAAGALGLDPHSPLLVHVGACVQGDLNLLLDAFAQLRRVRPEARLALLGRPRGQVRAERSEGVIRTGYVKDPQLRQWLAAAHLAVIPLRDTIANRGRWPSKVNEYLSAGRAVLITDVGDAAEWVRRGEAGFVAPPDARALADTAAAALASPAALAAAERNARVLAEGPLAWSHLADGVEAFYQQILGAPASAAAAATLS